MSSVIVISSYFFPLWIWNLRPTKFGKIVAERACVLIGACFSPAFARAMGRLRLLSRDVREEAEGPYGRMLGPSNVVSYTIVLNSALTYLSRPIARRAPV
jgi:hypothetical protein